MKSFESFYKWWMANNCPGSKRAIKMLIDDDMNLSTGDIRELVHNCKVLKEAKDAKTARELIKEKREKITKEEIKESEKKPTLKEATEETIEAYKAFVRNYSRIKPTHTNQVVFESNSSKPIAFTCFGDLHIGSKNCAYDLLINDLDTVNKTDGFYAVCNGDIINNFVIPTLTKAGRYDMPPDTQWRVAEGLIDSIKDFMLLITSGNHEAWTQELADIDRLEFLASSLNIPYTGRQRAGFIYFNLKGIMYKVLIIHKIPGGSKLNPLYPIKNLFTTFEYDVAIAGHFHTFGFEAFLRYGFLRYASMCGSYKTQDPFADMLALQNAVPFMPCFILFPEKREIQVVASISECARILTYYRTPKHARHLL